MVKNVPERLLIKNEHKRSFFVPFPSDCVHKWSTGFEWQRFAVIPNNHFKKLSKWEGQKIKEFEQTISSFATEIIQIFI